MLEIRLQGVERLARSLRVGDASRWMPWDKIAKWGRDTIDLNFQYGGRPQQWGCKKDGTMSRLQDTGALRESIESERFSSGVDIGYGMDYGYYHRTGTAFMQKRDFGEVLEPDLAELEKIIENALNTWLSN